MITEYSEFPEGVPRDRITRECLDTVSCLGKGWGTEDISFVEDKTFQTRAEAQKYLSSLPGDYDGYAVLFKTYDYRRVLDDPWVFEIRGDIKKIQGAIDSYRDHIQIADGNTTGYVKCDSCGSSLSIPHLKRLLAIKCPLCHADLRPKRDVARMEALEAQLNEKRDELLEAEDKAKRNISSTGTAWLVQYKIAT